jgi:raffinose/stachyose/melibiose transport system substrate-binding protein
VCSSDLLVNANGNTNALEVDVDNGVANFAKGEAAMLVTGPWYSDSILKVDPNFQLGLAALPVDDTPDHSMVMLAVSQVLTVHPKSPNKAVGIDFLNYILDDKDSSAFFKSLSFNKLAKNQEIPTFPWTAEGLTYLDAGRFYRDREIPNSPNDTLGSMAQLYYSKQITQQQFVDEIDKAWKKSVTLGK